MLTANVKQSLVQLLERERDGRSSWWLGGASGSNVLYFGGGGGSGSVGSVLKGICGVDTGADIIVSDWNASGLVIAHQNANVLPQSCPTTWHCVCPNAQTLHMDPNQRAGRNVLLRTSTNQNQPPSSTQFSSVVISDPWARTV